MTKEVEEAIKVPDYIPKIWEGGGGGGPPVDEVNAWTDFFEAGGVVPWLGGVTAFGVGTGIGSYICNEVLELEGCWYYGSESADPTLGSGEWVFLGKSTEAEGHTGGPEFAYWWRLKPGAVWFYAMAGEGGAPNPCGAAIQVPSGADEAVLQAATVTLCTQSGKTYEGHKAAGVRLQTTNRTFNGGKGEFHGSHGKYSGSGYCPLIGPGSTTCASKPPANWPERLNSCLKTPSTCGLTNEQRDAVGQHLAASTPKGEAEGIHDPLHAYATVPSCTATWTVCAEDLEELDLVPERDSVSWKYAVIEKGAASVLSLSPSTGSEVKTGTKVVVETNPDTEGMPAVIPDPEPHETYAHYIARLNPALDPTREIVTDANEDASAGPDAVLQVEPEPGTREDPATSTEVDVQTNPHDAPPVPVESGGCNASIGSIDLSPLNQPLGEKFPFGVVPFFISWIGEWSATGIPNWTLRLIPKGVFGSKGLAMHIDLGFFDSWAEGIRLAFVFASFAGMLWFLGTAFVNLRGDDS